MKQEKQVYESPKIEVVEFEIEDHIAQSSGPMGAGFTEGLFD